MLPSVPGAREVPSTAAAEVSPVFRQCVKNQNKHDTTRLGQQSLSGDRMRFLSLPGAAGHLCPALTRGLAPLATPWRTQSASTCPPGTGSWHPTLSIPWPLLRCRPSPTGGLKPLREAHQFLQAG